jgi:hypothetical protein
MKPPLRAIGVAVLAMALLNASAGLCFCHRGPVAPGEPAGSAGCCHGPEASDTTALNSPGICCHIESADSAATPAAATELAPPGAVSFAVMGAMLPAEALLPVAGAALAGHSPPPRVLRI